MGFCVAPRCKNSSSKGFRVFRFPADPKRRQVWLDNMKRGGGWKPTPYSQLCEAHFEESEFEKNRADQKRLLRPTAVPTKFDCNKTEPQGRRQKKRSNQENVDTSSRAGSAVRPPEFPHSLSPAGVRGDRVPRPVTGFLSDATNTVGFVPSADYNAAQVLLSMQFSLQGEAEGPASDSAVLTSQPPVTYSVPAAATSGFREVSPEPRDGACNDETCGPVAGQDMPQPSQESSLLTAVTDHDSSLEDIAGVSPEPRALQDEKDMLRNNLKGALNNDQLAALSRQSNRGSKWSEDTIKKGLQLHFSCGATGYDDILKQKLPYPSARTLRRRIEGIKFQPGVLHEVLDLLEVKVAGLGPQERCCLLMIDEMAIQQKIEYDPTTSSVRGYATLPVPGKDEKVMATHGLVFMLCGIATRWKQVVAYHYTGDSFSGIDAGNMVLTIIERCCSIGLDIVAVTTDMGSGNRSMWQYFKINSGKHGRIANVAQHPALHGKDIRFIADVPHIAKNLCGHLMNGQQIILHPDDVKRYNLKGCIISLEPIKRLAAFQDGSVFKLAPKVRKEVVDPNHFDKMKVSNAMTIFSHTTAVALRTMVETHSWPEHYLVTAWFIDQVNRWFDLICSRHPVMALSLHNPTRHEEAVTFLSDFMDMFGRLKIGNGHFKPCQAGVALSTTSILELQKHLLEDRKFEFVLTSRFTQDSLENFFSTVRLRNPIPTPLEFKMSLKIISVSQYLKVATTGSYEVDDGSFFLADFETNKQTVVPVQEIDTGNMTFGQPHLNETEGRAFFYYSGYIVSRVVKNTATCEQCRTWLTSESGTASQVSDFTTNKCYVPGALVYPSDTVHMVLLTCESCFTRSIEACMSQDNIISKLEQVMCDAVIAVDFPACHDIKRRVIRRFCHARLQLHLSELTHKSNTKTRDMGSKSMCAPRRQK